MLSERAQEVLNAQLNAGLCSSDLCLTIPAYCQSIKQQISLTGDAPGGLFVLDRELAQRQFTMLSMQAEGG